jgi:hypothetical protein
MRGHTDDMERTRPEGPPGVLEVGRSRTPVATIARWPLEVDEDFNTRYLRDPWQSMVRDSIAAYREGRSDVATWSWTPDIVWRVSANGDSEEHQGAERIFAYHQRLARMSGGTFRQRLIAIQGSQGPIVEAYLRTSARRGSRRLELPALVVFELQGNRIAAVTELPGDPAEWTRFWTD